jgi:hypothetical protein
VRFTRRRGGGGYENKKWVVLAVLDSFYWHTVAALLQFLSANLGRIPVYVLVPYIVDFSGRDPKRHCLFYRQSLI